MLKRMILSDCIARYERHNGYKGWSVLSAPGCEWKPNMTREQLHKRSRLMDQATSSYRHKRYKMLKRHFVTPARSV
jgi:hypothetical protein